MAFSRERFPIEDEPTDTGFSVGVERNADGSSDYSRAMMLLDTTGGELTRTLHESLDKLADRKKEKLNGRLRIPDDIKGGSLGAVWYELRNAKILLEVALEEMGDPQKRVERHRIILRKELVEIERSLLEQLIKLREQEGQAKEKGSADHDLLERALDSDASQITGWVSSRFIEPLKSREGRELTHIEQKNPRSPKYMVAKIIEAARQLEKLLVSEAT